MSLIKGKVRCINSLLDKLNGLARLIGRLVMGWVFLWAGYGKFGHLQQVIGFFESLGIPMASLQAPFIAALELVGGAFLILGFGTRIFSFLLASTMVVALVTAHSGDVKVFSDLFSLYQFGYILIFLFLITQGAGRFSVDAMLKKKC